jgi:hypothetical protein
MILLKISNLGMHYNYKLFSGKAGAGAQRGGGPLPLPLLPLFPLLSHDAARDGTPRTTTHNVT